MIVQSDSRKPPEMSRGNTVSVEAGGGKRNLPVTESSRLTEILLQPRDSKSAGCRFVATINGGRTKSSLTRIFLPPSIFSFRRLSTFRHLGRETLIPTTPIRRRRSQGEEFFFQLPTSQLLSLDRGAPVSLSRNERNEDPSLRLPFPSPSEGGVSALSLSLLVSSRLCTVSKAVCTLAGE